MTWKCDCGRKNPDSVEECSNPRCGKGPRVMTGLLGMLASFAVGALMVTPVFAYYGLPGQDAKAPTAVVEDVGGDPTPSTTLTATPVPSATDDCEGDCKPWQDYGYDGPLGKAAGEDDVVSTPTDDATDDGDTPSSDTPAGDDSTTNPNLQVTIGDDGKPVAVNTAKPTRGGNNAGEGTRESAPPAPADQYEATTKDQNAEEPSDDPTAG